MNNDYSKSRISVITKKDIIFKTDILKILVSFENLENVKRKLQIPCLHVSLQSILHKASRIILLKFKYYNTYAVNPPETCHHL